MIDTLLIVEDDAQTRQYLQTALAAKGFRVLESDRIDVGFKTAVTETPKLVILDLNLPDGSGLDLCRKIRAHKTLFATPIIMLTGAGALDAKVSGFSAGADQYLVKPVPVPELLLWVDALLRRLSIDKGDEKRIQVGELTVDFDAQLAYFKGERIWNLTVKEFELLYFLVRHRPKVLTRKYILSNLWRTVAVDHLVDTHMSNLKKKLPPAVADRVQNVPGKGFRYLE